MPQNASKLNSTTAPLTNVALCLGAIERGVHRSRHLPGLITFTAPSGWGKSTAAIYAANKHRAYYVECKDVWNRNAMLKNILNDMGITPGSNNSVMVDQICEQLDASGRPLIIDQADYPADKKYIETVRDIHDGCRTTILLIGEEKLTTKLMRWERVHSRILDFVLAQPADLSDAEHLRNLYCTQVQIADDLLEKIHSSSNGSCRRICTNLENMQEEALSRGLDAISLADVQGVPIYTGEPPKRGGK